jgi:N-succinyl-L-ornithine transcarbamylase
MNFTSEGWTLDLKNHHELGWLEHIKEAAVVSQYCDIVAIRALLDWWTKKRQCETVLMGFLKYATVPVVNMESADIRYNRLPML